MTEEKNTTTRLADGIITALVSFFCVGVVLNAVGQVTHNFEYQFPPELMELTREALAAAFGLRTVQGVRKWLVLRKTKE